MPGILSVCVDFMLRPLVPNPPPEEYLRKIKDDQGLWSELETPEQAFVRRCGYFELSDRENWGEIFTRVTGETRLHEDRIFSLDEVNRWCDHAMCEYKECTPQDRYEASVITAWLKACYDFDATVRLDLSVYCATEE
jgi:hypothetical protein